jgi:hypothetical protein
MKKRLYPKSTLAAAACALAFGIGAANASTFDVSGTFSDGTTIGGFIAIDVSAGTVTSEDITTSRTGVGPFTATPSVVGSSPIILEFGDTNSDELDLLLPVSTLVGYAGGALCTFSASLEGVCTDQATNLRNLPGAFSLSLNSGSLTPVATPLPAALPLFATGIGGLGLLGWRRKRKAQTVA